MKISSKRVFNRLKIINKVKNVNQRCNMDPLSYT